MKLERIGLLVLSLILCFLSCKKDDDGEEVVIEIRDRAEQQIEDMESLEAYLSSHYYNSSEINSITNPSISDLVITKLGDTETQAPNDHTLLIDELVSSQNPNGKLELHNTVFSETDYEFYILTLNKGGGADSPNFSDKIFVNYVGFNLENEVFDSTVNPTELNLIGNGTTTFGLIPGWRKVLPLFKTAEDYEENSDGTVNYKNYGSGVMFIPSGLAYFSSATTGISSYAPIIFKFELFETREDDHDGDGVPSHLEDLYKDGEFTVNGEDLTDDTDDDTDGDGFPDYVDTDDDGDGVLTINEDLEDMDLNVDSDGDGDPTNDKDGDGDPTNDDTDGDGIPNYLDADDAESKD